MIKLYSRHHLTPPDTPPVVDFDIDTLRRDVEKAFEIAGISETWMADHIILTLAEQSEVTETSADSATDQTDREARRSFIVSRMLVDAGYPDVAHAFAKIRRLPTPACSADAHPWNPARVDNTVRASLPLSESARKRLVPQVVDKLESLGFHNVADDLIRELAEHILMACAKNERDADGTCNDWLAVPGYWSGRFSDIATDLITKEALVIRPGSDLFPSPRGTLDLVKLIGNRCDAVLTELEVFPSARKACLAAAEALRQLLQQNRDSETSPPPGHLVVKGLREAAKRLLNTPDNTRVRQLSHDLEDCIRSTLGDYKSRDLIVSIQ